MTAVLCNLEPATYQPDTQITDFHISLEILGKQHTLMSLTFAVKMLTSPRGCVHLESRTGLVKLRLGQPVL